VVDIVTRYVSEQDMEAVKAEMARIKVR
jgi:hypothetical protein